MKQIPNNTVFFALLLSVLLIVTSLQVLASGQATILPTHLGFVDKLGYYHVVGEVENIGDKNIRFVRVNATFQDVNNAVISSRSSYVMLDVLLPGRKAPFEVVLGNKAESALVDHYSLSLTSQEYPGEKPSLLQIMKSTAYVDEAGFQKVNGTVKNTATSNATYVRVAATFFDTQGKVVGVANGYAKPSTIMPDQTEHFELELGAKAGNFSSYSLTGDSAEYSVIAPPTTPLMVSLTLGSTMVDSGANVSVQVHVTNGTQPVEAASVQLVSDQGGVFRPQSGNTNSTGDFTAVFTTPAVTSNTSITITSGASKIGFNYGQDQKQVVAKATPSPPVLDPWAYLAAAVLIIAALGSIVIIVRRNRRKRTKRTRPKR